MTFLGIRITDPVLHAYKTRIMGLFYMRLCTDNAILRSPLSSVKLNAHGVLNMRLHYVLDIPFIQHRPLTNEYRIPYMKDNNHSLGSFTMTYHFLSLIRLWAKQMNISNKFNWFTKGYFRQLVLICQVSTYVHIEPYIHRIGKVILILHSANGLPTRLLNSGC